MIDLSHQPQDKGPDAGTAQPALRHDPVPLDSGKRKALRRRYLTHERAESAVQLLSRWAGPAALLATAGLLGWWIIH